MGPCVEHIILNPMEAAVAEGYHPVSATLALPHQKRSTERIDVRDLQVDQLEPPDARGVERLQSRPIAQACRGSANWLGQNALHLASRQYRAWNTVRWNKVLDSEGNTKRLYKDVYDRAGKYEGRDWYVGGP